MILQKMQLAAILDIQDRLTINVLIRCWIENLHIECQVEKQKPDDVGARQLTSRRCQDFETHLEPQTQSHQALISIASKIAWMRQMDHI